MSEKTSNRIVGFDIARSVAFFGMVFVNYKIVISGSDTGGHWITTAIGLLEGRAAATFVVLAGVGVSLLSRTARETGDIIGLKRHRSVLLRRAAFLFFGGLLYTPIWPADILHFYGLYMILGAFLLGADDRRLWQVATILVVGFVLLNLVLDYETGWDWTTLTYQPFWTPAGLVRHMFFNGFHPLFPWAAFLIAGMWLGRQDFGNRRFRHRILLWSLAAVVAAELASLVLTRALAGPADSQTSELMDVLFGTTPMPPFPLFMIAGVGVAFSVIVACVGLTSKKADSPWVKPLVSTGQLALTLYVGHVVVGMGSLEVFGLLFDQSIEFAAFAALSFCLISVIFAHLWRSRFRRGPIEWLMRRATG